MKMEPSTPQTNERPNGLWRLAAPLAVVAATNLAGCVTAPPNPISNDVQKIQIAPDPVPASLAASRGRSYQHLREAIARDPQAGGRVLLIDPSDYSSAKDLARDAKVNLEGMIATWPQKPSEGVLNDVLPPIANVADTEDASLAPANSGSYVRENGKRSPDSALQKIALHAYWNKNLKPNDPNFICVAIGERAQMPYSTVLAAEGQLGQASGATPSTRFKPAFQEAVEKADPSRILGIEHELPHCLGVLPEQRDFTNLQQIRRDEAKSDVFRSLLHLQSDRPDAGTALETMVQVRRARQVSSFGGDESPVDHDTTQALRLLQRDMKKSPGMQKELAGLSPSALGEKAVQYAVRGSALEYPHLDDNSLSAKTRYAMTQQVDADFEGRARFVSGHMLVKGFREMPEKLTTQSALGIVQLAYAAENYLVQPPHSRLKQAMGDLRQRFPEQMREADRQFAQELNEFPPLQLDGAGAGATSKSGVKTQRVAQTTQRSSRMGI